MIIRCFTNFIAKMATRDLSNSAINAAECAVIKGSPLMLRDEIEELEEILDALLRLDKINNLTTLSIISSRS